jgi:NAD-dependent dihydropyrimidine dehydrogenase PreA subunit/coenzyme F420-reducing hydrogenase delta subunit
MEVIHEQMETLLQAKFKKKVLLFACESMDELLNSIGRKRREYPPVLPLFVPCLNVISELEVLRAFDLGADGVILLGCKQCPHGAVYSSALDFSGDILRVFGFGERLLALKSPETEKFVNKVEGFVSSLPKLGMEGGGLSFKNKREGIVELLRRFSSYTNTIPDKTLYGFPFGLLEGDSSRCTLCNTCIVMCPQEALQKNKEVLTFKHSLCIACGLCEKSCPEKAITLRKALDLRRLLRDEGEVVCRGEILTCPSCGKATISKNAFQTTLRRLGENRRIDKELLKFCPDCRALKALGLMGGGEDN